MTSQQVRDKQRVDMGITEEPITNPEDCPHYNNPSLGACCDCDMASWCGYDPPDNPDEDYRY